MAQRGRGVDADFPPTELLYRRCVADNIDPINPGRLYPDAISFYPDWSVNRQKYNEGHWDDVLYPGYPDCGVAEMSVEDVPSEIISEGTGSSKYTWLVKHKPLEDNYCHSEVWTFKEGTHIPNDENRNVKLPTLVKKSFRILLSQRAKIIKQPDQPHDK